MIFEALIIVCYLFSRELIDIYDLLLVKVKIEEPCLHMVNCHANDLRSSLIIMYQVMWQNIGWFLISTSMKFFLIICQTPS